MLIPLRPGELHRLIPAVATGQQFKASLGNPRKVLQRVLIATIGGVITLLISQSQLSSRWGSILLGAPAARAHLAHLRLGQGAGGVLSLIRRRRRRDV